MHNSLNSSLKKSVAETRKCFVSGHAVITAVVFALSGALLVLAYC